MINEYGFDSVKYNVNVTKPLRKDFTKNVPMFNETKIVKFFNQEAFREAHLLYVKEIVRVNNLFIKDMFENAGIEDNPKRMKLLDKVLEYFSDGGKEMIWQAVYEWSDLIKD